jgi:hypothetical protein
MMVKILGAIGAAVRDLEIARVQGSLSAGGALAGNAAAHRIGDRPVGRFFI